MKKATSIKKYPKKIRLEFKVSDFNGKYMSNDTCAITKALKRAGYPELRDEGTDITLNGETFIKNPKHRKLSFKVIDIFNNLKPKKAFVCILPVTITNKFGIVK